MTCETCSIVELAARIELALAAHAAAYGTMIALLCPQRQAAALAIGGGWAARTGRHLPINRAFGLGLRGPIDMATLDQLETFYRDEDLVSEVELCPLADASLHSLLRQRGYQYRRCMHTLISRAGGLLLPAPDDIEISVVSPEQTGTWVHTVAAGFGATTPTPEDSPDLLLPRSAMMRPNVTGFLATIGDEPAGAAAMAIGGGVAILFSASTLPAFQRRGVHSALLTTRMAAAAAAGCDLVVAQVVPGSDSQRNLHRHGFQVAYTNVILARP
ncbi:MAG: GNAT family N-acetyltransferase [Oscillochloris sp.]|nr:GNAT family N-acetyltransferase [Oscillochloris sp.]